MSTPQKLGRYLAEIQDQQLAHSNDDLAACRDAILSGQVKRSSVFVPQLKIVSAVAATMLLTIVVAIWISSPQPIIAELANERPVIRGQWLSTTQNETLPITFSDGSWATLSPNTEAQIESLDHNGGRIVLERGKLAARVKPRKESTWSMAAGPFQVRVTGTRFDVTWDRETQRFSLVLHKGSVVVDGPLIAPAHHVVAGYTLDVDLSVQRAVYHTTVKGNRMPIEKRPHEDRCAIAVPQPAGEIAKPNSSDENAPDEIARIPAAKSSRIRVNEKHPATVPQVDMVEGNELHKTTPSPSVNLNTSPRMPRHNDLAPNAPDREIIRPAEKKNERAEDGQSWVKLARDGAFNRALVEARKVGLRSIWENGSAFEVLTLGDIGRLTRDLDTATQAYKELRRRYPGSEHSATAAFALARIEFDNLQNSAAASRWLETCLSEAPDGRLAREALGRLIEARLGSGKPQTAQTTAKKYLTLYPKGPHAPLARRVLQEKSKNTIK